MSVTYDQPTPLPPGATLRFAVVAPDGKKSADWRLWTSKHTTDFYAAERTSVGDIKISFHKSGDWQIAYTAEAKQRHGIKDRLLHAWKRPTPLEPGWTQGPTFVFPDSELRHGVAIQESRPVVAVPVVGAGNVTFVLLFIEEASATRLVRMDNAKPIGILELSDGSHLHVIATRESLPDGWRDELFSEQLAEAHAVQSTLSRQGVEAPRILVYGEVDGEPWLVELTTDLPPSATADDIAN